MKEALFFLGGIILGGAVAYIYHAAFVSDVTKLETALAELKAKLHSL